jgi:hypothetical protein
MFKFSTLYEIGMIGALLAFVAITLVALTHAVMSVQTFW